MKTIALICHYLGPKLGIGQYLDQLLPPLVRALREQGLRVIIVSSPNASKKTSAFESLSDFVYVLPYLDASPLRRWLWFATQFNQYCKKNHVDLVVWLSNPVILPWHPISIAVIHDVNEWKSKEKYGSRIRTILRSFIYLDASLLFAKRVIAVSQSTEQDLKHFRPQQIFQAKLSTIVNGMDTSLLSLHPVKIPSPQAPFLLSVGRIDPVAKCLPESISLVQSLRELSEDPWEIHLVGGMNTSTQAEGVAFLKSVEAYSWVHYHGHVDDAVLAQWYRNSTAIVFLSHQEGFGLPIAEAFAFGRWAVVSQHNSAAVEAGGNAIISVAPEQPKQAAAKVLHCLSHGETPPTHNLYVSWQSAANRYRDEILLALKSSA